MNYLLLLLLLPLLVQALWLGAVLCAHIGRRRKYGQSETKSFVVVIPAHNESSSIENSVKGVSLQDYPKNLVQVYVIADNCSDDTADVARSAGANVIERQSDRKSKGFALEDCIPGILEESACDAIIVMDADSVLQADAMKYFSGALDSGMNRIQGLYVGLNPDASWRTKLMEWAFSLFNGVYLSGITAMGISSHLRGNGMCFSREALLKHPWKASGLAEDLEFSWSLRHAGLHVDFHPKAVVRGEFVSSQKAAQSQRSRWEEGRQEVHKNALKNLKLEKNRIKKFQYFLDLSLWPMGRLVGYSVVVLLLAALLADPWLLGLGGCAFIIVAAYICSPFLFAMVPLRYLAATLWVPYYIAWKVYIKILGKPADWVRTKREGES